MGTYCSLLVCQSAFTTPMPLVMSCFEPAYCQLTSSVLPLRLLSMTTSSNTRMPELRATSCLATAQRSFGCTRSSANHREILSWDSSAYGGTTSLRASAEYREEVTSRNEQYSSREHFERDIFVFPLLTKKQN